MTAEASLQTRRLPRLLAVSLGALAVLLLGAWGCGPKRSAVPPPLAECQHAAARHAHDVYYCKGHSFVVTPTKSKNPEARIEELTRGLVEALNRDGLRGDGVLPKLRIEKFQEFAGYRYPGVKVVWEHAIVRDSFHVVVFILVTHDFFAVCSAHTIEGMNRCGPELAYFAASGQR